MCNDHALYRERLLSFGMLLLLSASVVGCGDGDVSARGVRVAGEGFVTLDGDTLEMGRIMLITNQGQGEVKASAMVHQGVFTFTEESGPLEGEARVEIYPVEMELEDFEAQRGGDPQKKVDVTRIDIPAKYNVRSKLTANVSAEAGIEPLIFELTSK